MILLLLIVSVYSITGIVGRYCENSPYISTTYHFYVPNVCTITPFSNNEHQLIKYDTKIVSFYQCMDSKCTNCTLLYANNLGVCESNTIYTVEKFPLPEHENHTHAYYYYDTAKKTCDLDRLSMVNVANTRDCINVYSPYPTYQSLWFDCKGDDIIMQLFWKLDCKNLMDTLDTDTMCDSTDYKDVYNIASCKIIY